MTTGVVTFYQEDIYEVAACQYTGCLVLEGVHQGQIEVTIDPEEGRHPACVDTFYGCFYYTGANKGKFKLIVPRWDCCPGPCDDLGGCGTGFCDDCWATCQQHLADKTGIVCWHCEGPGPCWDPELDCPPLSGEPCCTGDMVCWDINHYYGENPCVYWGVSDSEVFECGICDPYPSQKNFIIQLHYTSSISRVSIDNGNTWHTPSGCSPSAECCKSGSYTTANGCYRYTWSI